jgi:hypothetical protein
VPQIPPGRLTFKEIRRFALAKAGNRAIITDANAWLCQLLYELYTGWNWPWLNIAVPLFINGPTFALPDDFLQAQDDNALQILTFDGQPMQPPLAFIEEVDPATFAGLALPNTAGGMPRRWTADRGIGVGKVWPDPTGHGISATFRYKRLPGQETIPPPDGDPTANDALVPAYPYHLHLIQGLAVLVMQYEQDPNAASAKADWLQELQGIRANAMPLRSQEVVIPLDQEVFGAPFTED